MHRCLYIYLAEPFAFLDFSNNYFASLSRRVTVQDNSRTLFSIYDHAYIYFCLLITQAWFWDWWSLRLRLHLLLFWFWLRLLLFCSTKQSIHFYFLLINIYPTLILGFEPYNIAYDYSIISIHNQSKLINDIELY